MQALALDHVVLEVRDVDAALRFYCDALGLTGERVDEFRSGSAPFPSVRAGGSLIDLFASATPGPGPNHFCIEVADGPEALLADLAARGVPVERPGRRYGARGEGFSVYVRDPDGHTIEVRTYA